MSDWAAKRFWKITEAVKVGGDYTVHLDGRVLKTPAKNVLVIRAEPLAIAVAEEWDAQHDKINPDTMPLTRAVNTAVDNIASQRDAVIDEISNYAGTDLTCYRAEAPQDLVCQQAAIWNPLLSWAEAEFNAKLNVTIGVLPVAQNMDALANLRRIVADYSNLDLTAIYDLTTLSGSLIIGLATAKGFLTPVEGWDASRIDENWQIQQWGADADAAELATRKFGQFTQAMRLLDLNK